jgi:hypothetical protein
MARITTRSLLPHALITVLLALQATFMAGDRTMTWDAMCGSYARLWQTLPVHRVSVFGFAACLCRSLLSPSAGGTLPARRARRLVRGVRVPCAEHPRERGFTVLLGAGAVGGDAACGQAGHQPHHRATRARSAGGAFPFLDKLCCCCSSVHDER